MQCRRMATNLTKNEKLKHRTKHSIRGFYDIAYAPGDQLNNFVKLVQKIQKIHKFRKFRKFKIQKMQKFRNSENLENSENSEIWKIQKTHKICAQNPHDGLFSRPSFLSSNLLRSDRRDLTRTDLRKADLFLQHRQGQAVLLELEFRISLCLRTSFRDRRRSSLT